MKTILFFALCVACLADPFDGTNVLSGWPSPLMLDGGAKSCVNPSPEMYAAAGIVDVPCGTATNVVTVTNIVVIPALDQILLTQFAARMTNTAKTALATIPSWPAFLALMATNAAATTTNTVFDFSRLESLQRALTTSYGANFQVWPYGLGAITNRITTTNYVRFKL